MNLAITTAGRLGRVEDAMEIFRGISSLKFKPDLMSYNNIIWSAGQAGKIALAKQLFEELLNLPTDIMTREPNAHTFGALIHACAKVKDYKQALIYLNKMLEEDIKPNLVVFTSAIEACSEAGQYKEALNLLNKMKQYNMKPDVTMINAAIKACCMSGKMDEADALSELVPMLA